MSAATLAAIALQACDPAASLGPAEFASAKKLHAGLCAFGQDFSLASTNPYFPISVGSRWQYEGEEDGALLELRITALDQTKIVGGVTTRVVEEVETADGELVEISRNFFATTDGGTVCYFGEEVDIYEGGEVVSHEGAWRADGSGNSPGIIMPANPTPGTTFPMERAPGIAQDQGKIVGIGPVEVPAQSFTETIRVREFNPLDRGVGFKTFAKGVGLIVDGPVELVTYAIGGGSAP